MREVGTSDRDRDDDLVPARRGDLRRDGVRRDDARLAVPRDGVPDARPAHHVDRRARRCRRAGRVPLRGRHQGLRRVHQRVEGRRAPARRLLLDAAATRARSRSRCSGTPRTRSRCSRSPTTSTRTRAGRTSRASARRSPSTINKYARDKGLLKEKEDNLEGEDVREGLAAVISVKLAEPQFEGQTKTKLGNPWVSGLVSTAVNQKLVRVLRGEPDRRTADHQQGDRRVARAPGGAQGARADAPQVGAREHVAARQARGLLDQGSRGGRALHRRGRQRRRLGEDGPRPHLPGDPAAAREDHQHREEPHQQGPLEQRDPGDDHCDRHRDRRRVRRSRSFATTA